MNYLFTWQLLAPNSKIHSFVNWLQKFYTLYLNKIPGAIKWSGHPKYAQWGPRLLHILNQHCLHFLYKTKIKIIGQIDQSIWYNSIEIFQKKHHPSVKILSHFISNFTFWLRTQKPKGCMIQTSNKFPAEIARIQKFTNPVNSLGSIN